MAICEQGYLCDLCGEDVADLSDSDLYLRYVLGEVPPEDLHRTPERHIRCNPILAQFIVTDGFEPLAAPGFFDKAMLDPTFVAEEEERVTRGYLRLVELVGQEVSLVEYPLPEVVARWRETVASGEALAARRD
jgi:hypothetical protein